MRSATLFAFFGLAAIAVAGNLSRAPAQSRRGMVATVHPVATQAGVAAFRQGGNAVDAAVAAAVTLGVVDGHNSGLGGGCFVLLRTADGRFVAIDGRETAPAAAWREMFLRDGRPRGDLSQTGALAIATPGALAAYSLALDDHGSLTLAELMLPAAEIAEQGFAIDRIYAQKLADSADELRGFAGSRAALLRRDGSPYAEGDVLRQPDLASTYRSIARHGPDWFYRGQFAEAVDRWMRANGGLLTAEDFSRYRALRREPLVTSYRQATIVGFPPPSSGGVHVAQMLNILESFDVAEMFRQSDGQLSEPLAHLLAETMKRAFADRAHWLGDADHVSVPRGLISKKYGRELAATIDMQRALAVEHGAPPGAASDFFPAFSHDAEKHTTHIAAADEAGNWVAITATVNTTFGAKVVIPGTGVVMNNQMDDFAIAPGSPNAFGLIGAEANAVAPGKRPLSSMSPTIVLRDDKPIMTLGAAGGPKIITQVLLALSRTLDGGQSLPDALAAPRIHHQWAPDAVFLEPGFSPALTEGLSRRGHTVRGLESAGVTQAIGVADDGVTFVGVHDPRVPGLALGY